MSQEDFTSLIETSTVLTHEFLNKNLSKWFKKNVKFTHWEYVGETGKGDSYLSELIRIKMFCIDDNKQTQHVQVILKTIPKSVSRRLTYRSDEFFRNEIQFYEHVLPALLRFQATKTLTEPFDNYAKVVMFYVDGINDVLCLEDLSIENFGAAVRQKGIDLEHCKIVLKTFAKFHAISFALKDQDAKLYHELETHVFETYYCPRVWSWYELFWKKLCGIAIDAVEKEYPGTIYEKKIKEFATPAIYDKMIDAAMNTKETGVFLHGDSWTNNFLFKYEAGARVPLDAKMIDFQLTRSASPILDISFFIYACTSQELRLEHYEELLAYYYDILARQIKEMGSDPKSVYSWELFKSECKKYSYFGLAFSFESTPFIVLDPEDAIDMEMEGTEKRNITDIWQLKPFKTKEGRLREANNVVHAVDNGFI